VHASGWVRSLVRPEQRVDYEILLPDSGEILGRGCADQFGHGLAGAGVGDGAHAFWTRLSRPLDATERDRAVVRVAGHGQDLLRAPNLRTRHEPLLHVAMDVVDNCNLRCPFCLYDYEHTRTTHFMSAETLDAALRFLPYVRDGEFWFSCLHEPTLHPELTDFIDRVPAEYRKKLFFTTNLAKRMPVAYFDWLAGNGMHHVNVSIESRDPAVYERMRKGARHRIFQANWDLLVEALDRAPNPTPIRYIAMAYKSNLRELPGLARYLLAERRAAQFEIRYTFDVPYIPAEFRAAEFLDAADWAWLAAELADLPRDRLQLILPPHPAAAAVRDAAYAPAGAPAGPVAAGPDPMAVLPGRMMFRLSWDGTLKVVGVLAASRHDAAVDGVIATTNIRDIADPAAFFAEFDAYPKAAVALA
jgi:hypothetical protein